MKIMKEAVRSTTMGKNAIDNIMPYVSDEELKKVIEGQKERLETTLQEAGKELSAEDREEAEGSKLSKTVLKASSVMSAMMNSEPSHIARMLIEGYEMGIVSMQKCINDLAKQGDTAPALAVELVKSYDRNIKALRKFL